MNNVILLNSQVDKIQVVENVNLRSAAMMPSFDMSLGLDRYQAEAIPLEKFRLNYNHKIDNYSSIIDVPPIESILSKIVQKIQREIDKISSSGIDVFTSMDNPRFDTIRESNTTSVIFEYMIREDDLYKMSFVDGCSDEALQKACNYGKQIINRKIDLIWRR